MPVLWGPLASFHNQLLGLLLLLAVIMRYVVVQILGFETKLTRLGFLFCYFIAAKD